MYIQHNSGFLDFLVVNEIMKYDLLARLARDLLSVAAFEASVESGM